jgi:DNA circularisation protein N-terminus/Pectate lyase superfamily protein
MEIKDIVNPWREILRSQMASFGGVVFHVETGSRSSGRRTVTHEYPKRNEPYAEDMGRHARRFQFSGYLIYRPSNPNYQYTTQRRRLSDKLEADDADWLVHPVFAPGGMMAVCERYSMSESRERGGYTQFEMSFVEAGTPGNFNVAGDTKATAQDRATASEKVGTNFLSLQLAPFVAPIPTLPIFVPSLPPTDGGGDGGGDGGVDGGIDGGTAGQIVVISDENVTGSVSGNTITLGWQGLLSPARGGFGVDLSATGGPANVLKQPTVGGPIAVDVLTDNEIAYSGGPFLRPIRDRIIERGISVKDYGAVGDASVDDTTAFQNAINAADDAHCDVLVPYGLYMLLTGVTVSGSVRLIGTGGNTGAPVLWCGFNDISVVTLDGFRSGVQDLEIIGAGAGCTKPTLYISENAVEATVYDIRVWGGFHAIECRGSDSVIWNIHADIAYGDALVKLKNCSGIYMYRCKCDHSEGTYPAAGSLASVDAWIPNHVYATNAFVSIDSETWMLQCQHGGQSGTVEPNVADYGTDIPDGLATWRLVAPFAYASLQIDNCYSCFIHGSDHSGLFTAGIVISDDDDLGNGPESIVIEAPTVGATWIAGIYVKAGSGNTISHGILTTTLLQGTAAVWIANEGNDFSVCNNLIAQCPIGVLIQSGQNVVVADGNRISGASVAAVYVNSGVGAFIIVGNTLGTGHWGQNTYPFFIEAGGSDHYTIMANLVFGSVNTFSDGGTGTNKTITGNR